MFYYLRPWATSVLFLSSINPMLQRRSFSCFFFMWLISNSHRVERSTNFLIMKKRKSCRRPRPCGGCSCPACESIARQRQRICRVIACKLALDSFRLKSTEDQGKNGTSQHQGWSFTSIIRNAAPDGECFTFYCSQARSLLFWRGL